jgi:hypothetical protein
MAFRGREARGSLTTRSNVSYLVLNIVRGQGLEDFLTEDGPDASVLVVSQRDDPGPNPKRFFVTFEDGVDAGYGGPVGGPYLNGRRQRAWSAGVTRTVTVRLAAPRFSLRANIVTSSSPGAKAR